MIRKWLHALGALILTTVPAFAADEDSGIGNVNPTTPDKAILITLQPDKTMLASFIKVQHITDGKTLLCFKDPTKLTVGCFVVNVNTGQTVFIELKTDTLST